MDKVNTSQETKVYGPTTDMNSDSTDLVNSRTYAETIQDAPFIEVINNRKRKTEAGLLGASNQVLKQTIRPQKLFKLKSLREELIKVVRLKQREN